MLLKNKIFVWFVLLVFLAGNIGVAVNKHICYSEGIVEFYFSSEDISCGEHNAAKHNVSSCCKKPVEQKEQNKPDCCNDDVLYAVLDIDQLQAESKLFSVQLFASIITFIHHHFNFDSVSCSTFNYISAHDPPLWQSKNSLSFLSFVSVFRI